MAKSIIFLVKSILGNFYWHLVIFSGHTGYNWIELNFHTFRLEWKNLQIGQWCGSVGRAVASNSRGPQFKSSHRQKLYWTFTVSCIERTKIKKKEAGNCPFFGKKPSEDPITCLSKLFLYCLFTVKMNPSAPVWPGIAIKLSHFPKSCPKSIYLKFVVFPQKLPSIWSLFVRKFVANTYQK